jgi:hypothetical protein
LIQALFCKLKFTQFEFKDLYFILDLTRWDLDYMSFRDCYFKFLITNNNVKNTSNLGVQFQPPDLVEDINKAVTYQENANEGVGCPSHCLRGIHV